MKILHIVTFLLLTASIAAQEANRPVLVEHFTNTYCSICANRNPPLYDVMKEFGSSVHHISYFPSQPYNQCPLYNYNTAGNGAREKYYGILATPSPYVNGLAAPNRADGFRDAISAQISQNARVLVAVDETTGSERDITVTLTGQTNGEFSDFRLFVALVERNLEFAADNGETEHFNVFRKMVTANEGDQINVPAPGETATFNFKTNVESGIALEEAYILAYVQDLVTGEILGSGTRFDEATTSAHSISPAEIGLIVYPNPTTDHLQISLRHGGIIQISIRNLLGQTLIARSFDRDKQSADLDLTSLPSGTYLLSAFTKGGVASVRIAKR